jgi:hypothetical protein
VNGRGEEREGDRGGEEKEGGAGQLARRQLARGARGRRRRPRGGRGLRAVGARALEEEELRLTVGAPGKKFEIKQKLNFDRSN